MVVRGGAAAGVVGRSGRLGDSAMGLAGDDLRDAITGHPMKYFYLGVAGALVVTVLAVLFVPGVDDFVERTFQGYVGRAAR